MQNETDRDWADEDEAAAGLDRWNDAALAALRGQPRPAGDTDSRDGYAYGLDARKVRVVMPARVEGYYHALPTTH